VEFMGAHVHIKHALKKFQLFLRNAVRLQHIFLLAEERRKELRTPAQLKLSTCQARPSSDKRTIVFGASI
jgi:hypothetical protein